MVRVGTESNQKYWDTRKKSQTYKDYLERTKEKRKLNRRAYYEKNKERELNLSLKWAKNNPDKVKERYRKSFLKKAYNLTLEEYKQLHLKQEFRCYICQEEKKLFVDHNHESGKVRSLLCHHCNSGLGLFKENPFLLREAAKYVELHNE